MLSSIVLMVPTTTSPVRVTRLRKLPASVDQATLTLSGSSAALPVSARYSDFVRAPLGPIERSSGHGAWKAEVSASLDVGESWNLGMFLAHALKAYGRLQEQQGDALGDTQQTVWATGAVDVIDLRILPVSHIETKLRQALAATPAPALFLLPPDNLGDAPSELRTDLEARGTRIIAPATMAEALEALGLPLDWAKEAAPDLAGWRDDPYRGLESYQAEHRPIFFGRASARAEALERLRTRAEQGSSLLVIHGRSGVGKSSLAMAGLLDDVVEQVPGRAPFGMATIRFGDGATPLTTLRTGFAQALGLEDTNAIQSSSATEWLGTWPENTEPRTLLLILDQLEQALLAEEADTVAFGEAVATLVQTGRVWIIATLRSDRIDLLERAPALADMADGDALYRLVRPTLAELGEIIRAPAKLAGIEFEETEGTGLVELLAEEAMRAPDSLPLLQVTLMRLADQRDAEGRVGMRDYERIGGFSGAVGRLADETVRRIEADGIDASVVDQALASLVRIDPETDRVDARVVDPDMQTAEVQQVLGALVEARLATASTESEALDPDADSGSANSAGPSGGGRRVRLSHETLIREWPRLHDLAARLRSELSLRDRLEEDALRWDQDGRPQGDLIRNAARLTAAEDLTADGLAAPSPQAQTYIEASRAETERQVKEIQVAADKERRARTRRRISAAAALVTVVILGMAGFAINQTQQKQAAQELAEVQTEATRQVEEQLEKAQINQARFLLESARSLSEEDPAQAVALMAEPLLAWERLQELDLYDEAVSVFLEIDLTNREIHRFEGLGNVQALSSDGTLAATYNPDGDSLIWDVSTGKALVALEGPITPAGQGTFSRDGTKFIAAGPVPNISPRIWDVATGRTIWTLAGHGDFVLSTDFSPDGTLAVTGSWDRTVKVWDVDTGRELHTFDVNTGDAVLSVKFSPDGAQLVIATVRGKALVIDATTGEKLAVLNHTNSFNRAVAFSPDGTRVAISAPSTANAGLTEFTVEIWDPLTGRLLQTLEGHTAEVTDVAFSSSGNRIVTGSLDTTARVWDTSTGQTLLVLSGHKGLVNNAAFSSNGAQVITSMPTGTIRVWDIATGQSLYTIDESSDRFLDTRCAPSCSRIATGSWYTNLKVWDVEGGQNLFHLESDDDGDRSLAFSPDGTRWVTGSKDAVQVRDGATGQVLLNLEGHGASVTTIAFSQEGAQFVTGSSDGTVRVWDVETGHISNTISGLGVQVVVAALSPDNNRVIIGSRGGAVEVWNIETEEALLAFERYHSKVASASFSPDGTWFATGSWDGNIIVWNVETGEKLLQREGSAPIIQSDIFSPDSSLLITGAGDHVVEVVDISTGQTLQTFVGSAGSFSPIGTQIVTWSDNGRAWVWDITTGRRLLTLAGHTAQIWNATFSADGSQIVTQSSDQTTRVWGTYLRVTDQIFRSLPLISFEPVSEANRRRFLLGRPPHFETTVTDQLSRVRSEMSDADWEVRASSPEGNSAVFTDWSAAAEFGVPEAHAALSTVLLTGHAGIEPDSVAALFHAAIATRIYEALGDEESAAPMRIRRANLARSLPPETVAGLWPRVRDWRPQTEE